MFKKWILLFLVISSTTIFADRASQELKWQAMEEEVSQWGDGMGLGLDEGVKETVAALNLLGFVTRQSCEGHMDWGRDHPWIDFPLNTDLIEMSEECNRLMAIWHEEEDKLDKEQLHDEDFNTSPETYNFRVARDTLFAYIKEYDRVRTKIDHSLHPYLEKFYQNHFVSYDAMLIIESDNLTNRGSAFQIFRTESEREQKLLIYQNEMKAFGAFLKEEFLSQ